MRRTFNRTERNALWLAAGGRCQMCGEELGRSWEADHIVPWSRGGETDVRNGQALCRTCNRSKGATVGGITSLRPHQHAVVNAVLTALNEGRRQALGLLATGSGKTLAALAAYAATAKTHNMRRIVIYEPRTSLRDQINVDIKREYASVLRGLYGFDIGKVPNVDGNRSPLINPNHGGVITTYSALTANPSLHLGTIDDRTFVFCDEVHQCGVGDDGDGGTKAGEVLEEVIGRAGFVFGATATAERAQGGRIVMGDYRDNHDGTYTLIPDVSYTYRDGLNDRTLLPVNPRMLGGDVKLASYGGDEPFELAIEEYEGGIRELVTKPNLYRPAIDTTVAALFEQRAKVPGAKAMIAAATISHADDLFTALREAHPNVRACLAHGKEVAAQRTIDRFRQSQDHDVLVVVDMAGMGFDCREVMVVCNLSSKRTYTHMMQLTGRALRVVRDVDYDMQTATLIAPDDPRMQRFVSALNADKEAVVREPGDGGDGPGPGDPLWYIEDATVHAVSWALSDGSIAEGPLSVESQKLAAQLGYSAEVVYRILDAKEQRANGQTVSGVVRSDLDDHRRARRRLEDAVCAWARLRAIATGREWREVKRRMSDKLLAQRGGLEPKESSAEVLEKQAKQVEAQLDKRTRRRRLFAA